MGLKVGPITPSLGEPAMRASSSTAPGSAAISSALLPEGPEGPEAPEGPDCADGPKGETSGTGTTLTLGPGTMLVTWSPSSFTSSCGSGYEPKDLKSGDLFNKSGDLNMDRSRWKSVFAWVVTGQPKIIGNLMLKHYDYDYNWLYK